MCFSLGNLLLLRSWKDNRDFSTFKEQIKINRYLLAPTCRLLMALFVAPWRKRWLFNFSMSLRNLVLSTIKCK
jgi:hypothetical protein